MVEVLTVLLRVNLVAGAAILLILVLRGPVRRAFGPDVAYGLWAVAPVAALAGVIPARTAGLDEAPTTGVALILQAQTATQTTGAHAPLLLSLWAVGAAIGIILLFTAQLRFMRRVAEGRAGPAVVGFVAPRMVTPSDYDARFTSDERQVIRAHERVHIDRQDPRANALIALMQAVNWFNPLVHLAAYLARLDQELACDAAVLRRYPLTRRRYAEALLKSQLGSRALPLGCHWGAGSRHPLEARIEMLARPTPDRLRGGLGGIAVAALCAVAAYGAWAAQPARAAQPSFFRFEAPQLWSVEVVGEGGSVRICTDATLRAGFARPTPVFGDEPCAPIGMPTGAVGDFAFRCQAADGAYGVTSKVRGDFARDFTTRVVVSRLDGGAPAYHQTRRHKRLGPCPSDWIIGDQTGQGGAMIANSVSAQRALRRS